MIKVKHAALLAFLLVALPFCGKNPVDPPADENEEHILFIRNSSEFNEVCTMLPDGTDIQVITRYDGDDYYPEGYSSANWSSDKTKLVAEGGPGSHTEYRPLWLMDSDGGLLRRLTWNGHNPFWILDDETIIYTRRRGYFSQTWDIYGLTLSTFEEDTLLWAETGPPGTLSGYIYGLRDVFPNDNSKLLLGESYTYLDSSGKMTDDDLEIVIYDISSQQKIYLTDNDTEEGWAKVSPDGTRIAFTRKNHGVYPYYTNNLYLMTAEGDSLRQLTDGTTYVYMHILWSPDGNYIVCQRADQSEGYNAYGDIIFYDLELGTVDTLIAVGTEEIYYTPADWR